MKFFTLVVSLSLASVSIAAAVPALEGLIERRQAPPGSLPFGQCETLCSGRPVTKCVGVGNNGNVEYGCA
ncbi:hypothetical protein HYFRA_00010981 [Hymenoscyphus fraxineus]|uniref:Uncharacterized protein n=1 Tax=Hymenoscyphus fraxineus TaxID=746836 RepID=A0A9N9PTZ6_9HELO|nr:hypothetical protein HYFRA_00010981 [Hymenoscyphus fraxineus]